MEHTVAYDSELLFIDTPVLDLERSIENTEATLRDRSPSIDAGVSDRERLSYPRSAARSSAVATSVCDQDDIENNGTESETQPIGGAVKRMFDVVVALAAITALLPMLALLSVAVRLECSGPILFRQRRIGFDGREFTCLKFRTMGV